MFNVDTEKLHKKLNWSTQYVDLLSIEYNVRVFKDNRSHDFGIKVLK